MNLNNEIMLCYPGVVLCYGLERGNPEILSFVTIKPEARIAAKHIEAALKNSLTHYMIPQVSTYIYLIHKIAIITPGRL